MFTHPQSTLEQLDLEQFSSQVIRYGKYVNQLEKGLPRNSVVPTLKDKVEVMKQRVGTTVCFEIPDNVCSAWHNWLNLSDTTLNYGLKASVLVGCWLNFVTLSKSFSCGFIQLPVITDLRNPCMKPEHWKSLESVVGTSLNVEELTVAVLEEINIFSYGMEIQEVTHK